jgi:hypothetical protein
MGRMIAALLRLARILVAQTVSWSLLEWGGIVVPMLNITVGAAVSAIFKYLRDKYPKLKILEWLPL